MSYFKHWWACVNSSVGRSYCEEWDKELNSLIDNMDEDVMLEKYTLDINRVEVWIGGYPYYYGHCYRVKGEVVPSSLQKTPSIKTRYKLKMLVEKLENDKIKEEENRFYARIQRQQDHQ